MTRYVLGFCFDYVYQNVLLIQKSRPDWQKGKLNGIGGHIEPNETPLAAMQREATEETGGWIGRPTWFGFGRLVANASTHSEEVWLFHSTVRGYLSSEVMGRDYGEGRLYIEPRHLVHSNPSVLPNLRWLIEMAFNHAKNLDKAPFFQIQETQCPLL